MPTYRVTDSYTGKVYDLTGDSPPTDQELEEIFGQAEPPKPPEERGFLGDIASRAARGTVQAVKQIGGGLQMLDRDVEEDTGIVGRAGRSLTDWATRAADQYDILKPDASEVQGQEGIVKRGVMGAVESTPASLIPMAGGLLGAKAGALAGTAVAGPIGTVVGGVAGGVIGGGLTLFGTFGLGEYKNTYDETKQQLRLKGVPESEVRGLAHTHALKSAVAETGGEFAGDLAALTFFGAFGKRAISQGVKKTVRQLVSAGGVKEFAKAYAKTAPFEVGSEMGTSYVQTKSAQETGISDMTPAQGMAEAILPAAFMSLIFGASIRGMQAAEARSLYKRLNSQSSAERAEAASEVAGRIDKDDRTARETWLRTASDFISSGREIPLSKPIVDLASQKPTAAKPEMKNVTPAPISTPVEDTSTQVETPQGAQPGARPEALTPEFLQGFKTALDRGADEQGNPFTVEDAAAVLEAYRKQPNADPRSVATLEALLGQKAAAAEAPDFAPPPEATPRQITPDEAYNGFVADLAGNVMTDDEAIAERQRLVAAFPDLADEFNKAFIEWKGSKLNQPGAPVVPEEGGQADGQVQTETPIVVSAPLAEMAAGTTPIPAPAAPPVGEQPSGTGNVSSEGEIVQPGASSQATPGTQAGAEGAAKEATPAPFQKGDRVVIDGKHGAISEVTAFHMQPILGGGGSSETIYSYRAKFDSGREESVIESQIQRETEKPTEEEPRDILVDLYGSGSKPQYHSPESVVEAIQRAKRNAVNYRAAAGRAKLTPNRNTKLRQAKEEDELAERLQRTFDMWAENWPAAAEKFRPVKKAEGAPATSPGSLSAYGIDVTKSTTNKGTPVWNVSGNTKAHVDAMKRAGGRWYSPKKVWSFYDGDPTDKLLEALGGKKGEEAATDTRLDQELSDAKVRAAFEAFKIFKQTDLVKDKEAVLRLFQWLNNEEIEAYNELRDAFNAKAEEALGPAKQRPTKRGESIGRNSEGEEIFEDENEVRSIVENGIRLTEPVAMVPTRGGVQAQPRTPRDQRYEVAKEQGAAAPAFGAENKIFTEDKAAKAREILRKKLGGLHMGVPLDPEIIQAGIDLAGYYIEGGSRSFGAYAEKMIGDLGDVVRPYLKSFYMAVRNYPGFDKTGMNTEAEVDQIDENTIDIAEKGGKLESREGGEEGASPGNADEQRAEAAPRNDQRGNQGEVPEPVPGTQEGGATVGVRARPGTRDDGELRGGPPENPEQETAGQLPGDREAAQHGGLRAVEGRPGDVAPISGRNYRISDGELTRTGSWYDAAKTNLDVIELLRKLDEEKRPATDEEKSLLVKYVGWGASELANNMFPGVAQTGELRPSYRTGDRKWDPLVERLGDLLSPDEIKTAARSTQYAHYTSEAVIRAIYNGLERIGFRGGRVLEPGMGIGHFAGILPWKSTYTGIEMDATTARIAKYLYPKHNVKHEDFTKTTLPNDFFDLSIGNPPFAGTVILSDPAFKKNRFKLHEYFMAKSLAKTKPGGLMVFISSRYAMDKVDEKFRKYIEERADLLGAIRLPQTAFKQNAGTEVVTDVMFFRKRLPGEQAAGQAWKNLQEVQTEEGPVNINEYFASHPEMILGKNSLTGSMYREKEYTVLPAEGDIEGHFAEAVTNLPEGLYDPTAQPPDNAKKAVAERDMNPTNRKEGGLYVGRDGHIMRVESGTGVRLSEVEKIKSSDLPFLKDYILLRDALKQAQLDQLNDGEWEKSLKALNKQYGDFVKKHGNVQAHTVYEKTETDEDGNAQVVEYRRFKHEKLIRHDIESSLVWALEKIGDSGEIIKSPFLSERTIKPPVRQEIKTPSDALAVTLDERGHLDLDHISTLLGESRESVIEQLGDLIFEDPTKGYVLADEYLSGDVVKKLEEAKAAAATDKRYARNVKPLEDVQPVPLAAEDIPINLGENWISMEYYTDFAQEVLGINGMEVTYRPSDNTWKLDPEREDESAYYYRRRARRAKVSARSMRSSSNEWGTADRGPNEILEAILNNASLRITRTERFPDGSTKTYLDEPATAAVNDIAKRMRKAFGSWIWQDAERANDLLTTYNRRFNNIAGRRLDGRHLSLPGFTSNFTPHDHQKRAIWRILQAGNTYLAHAVGAGKTMEMIAAGMEMKRLGLISKPLYVVPKHMLQQFANEFQLFYPMAHVMVADEANFHTENRRRFIAQAALNNPDAVVITHPSLAKLKMKAENVAPVRDAYLQDMRDTLSELEEDKKENRIKIKQMEKRIEQAEQRFDAMIAGEGKDGAVSFEELGCDFVFVDEAHMFRKLDFVTNRQVKGIDPVGSVRAMDLYIKAKYLEQKNPGRSHVFASGTPVVNTIGELYTIMKFFAEKEMDQDGIHHFDAWANMFGEVVSDYEMNAAGRYELVERFSRFVKIPELMSRVREFTDVLTMSQLGKYVVRPDIKGGQPKIVVTAASPALKDYQNNVLMPRIEASKRWKPSPGQPGNPDPLINIITDGRLASIDLRFVGATENDPKSKLNTWIDGIIQSYDETRSATFNDPETGKEDPAKGGTQICFYNLGFGEQVSKRRRFDARAWVTKRFKEAGIPAGHIAWIDDYKTAQAKEAVFKEMRQGKKRILIGSAKKMGTGVNVQRRLVDLHYLDAPWYPADVEQPDGRILRQGNLNKEVGLFRYATKGSYDATMWQMVSRKSKMTEQAWSGDKNVRSIEDFSESSQYAMASAMAAGDERVIHLVGLQNDIARLGRLKEAHEQQQMTLRQEKRQIESNEIFYKARIADLKAAEAKTPEYIRDIEGKIGGKTYDNRAEFGQKILDKYNTLKESGKKLKKDSTIDIATLNGIKISFFGGFYGTAVNVEVTDKVKESIYIEDGQDPRGLITKMVNFINGLKSAREGVEEKLEDDKKNILQVIKRIGAPFEHANELAEKIAEEARLKEDLASEGETSEITTEEAQKIVDEKAAVGDRLAAARKQVGQKWEAFAEENNLPAYPDEIDNDDDREVRALWLAGQAKARALLAGNGEGEIEAAQAALDGARDAWDAITEREDPYPPEFITVQNIITSIRQKQGKLFPGELYSTTAKAAGWTLDDVKQIFKGQEVVQTSPGGPIYIKTRGGKFLTIESVEHISPNEVNFKLAYGRQIDRENETITGAYGQGNVRLVRGKAGKWTLAHESAHFLEDAGILSTADIAILRGHIKGLVRDGKMEAANPRDIGGAEDRANFLADQLTAEKPVRGLVGRVIARVREFLDRVMEAFGKRTARGVVRDVESGAIFEREGAEGAGAEAYAATRVSETALQEKLKAIGADVFVDRGAFGTDRVRVTIGGERKGFGRLKDAYEYLFEEMRKRQASDLAGAVDKILDSKEQYSVARTMTDPPGPEASREKVRTWIADTTDAYVQTLLNRRPSQLPHMTFLEKVLKSPEWYSHPQISRIVRLFMRDRNEIYHEYMNHLIDLGQPGVSENTVSELARDLKCKGLTWKQRLAGETSQEYQDLLRYIDRGDTELIKPEDMLRIMQDDHASPDTIRTWKAMRESYDKALDLMTQQMREMMEAIEEEAAFKGITPVDYSAMYRTLKGALKMMRAWRGSYAPRIRRGNWVVEAERGQEETREFYREHRYSEMAARRLSAKLEREGWTVRGVNELQRIPEDVYQDISTVSMAKVIEATIERMKKGEATGEVRGEALLKFNEDLLVEVADMIRARGFRSTMIHRRPGAGVVRGYLEDPLERHLIYCNNVARGMAKAKVAKAATEELMGKTIRGRRFGGIDPVKEPRAYSTAKDYIEEQLRNLDTMDRWIGLGKCLATLKFLGFSVRAALVNMTALATTAPPAIQQYVGDGRIGFMRVNRELAKAGKDFGAYMAGRADLEGDEERFILEQRRLGWDDPQYTRDAIAKMAKIHNQAWTLLMDGSMYVFGKTEQFNRGATMLAAYRLARKLGHNHDQAAELAKNASDKAHGIYGRATLPSWAWGRNPAAKIAQMLYVFSKFSHNYLQMLYDLGIKKRNISGALYALVAPVVIGGLSSLPFKDQLFAPVIGAIMTALGLKDKDEDPEKVIWRMTRQHLGDLGERAGRYGLFGALGIDISGSLSIGVGLPRDWYELGGAVGGVAKEAVMAGEKIRVGRYGRAAEHLLPSGLASFPRAYRESQEGITTERERPLWDESGRPYMPTSGETLLRLAGARSSGQATMSSRAWEGKREAANFQDEREDIYNRYRAYVVQTDKPEGEFTRIRELVRAYNKRIRDAELGPEIPVIKFSEMRTRIQRDTRRAGRRERARIQ